MSPDDSHSFGLCHIFELLEISPDVSLVRSRVKYLDLKCHKVIRECLQDYEHNTAHNHLIYIIRVLNPNVLETNYVLPTPFNTQLLVSM